MLCRRTSQELAVQTARQQRRRYRETLGNRVVILKGATYLRRNGDVDFSFRQHSDFLYLSACDLPDVHMLLSKDREILLVPKVDETHLVWLGYVPSPNEIKAMYGFDQAQYNDQLDELIKEVTDGTSSFIVSPDLSDKLQKLCPDMPMRPWRQDVELQSIRVLKNPSEIQLIQEAALASSAAHLNVMQTAKVGMMEWQIQDLFLTALRQQGLRDLSFPTIAACGRNAAVLHYTRDMSALEQGQLLLLDAGGEWLGYAGDITRTWPVGPRFSDDQKEMYNIVLMAKHKATALAKSGVWMSELQACVMRELTHGLREWGLLHGRVEDLLEHEAVRLFYPHGCSHQLGLDVHDVSPRQTHPTPISYAKVRSDQLLSANMVITMEPGLYFIEALIHSQEKREKLDKWINWEKAERLLGFGGIRIEDDLLVQENGCQQLSSVPETVEDLESIRGSANLHT